MFHQNEEHKQPVLTRLGYGILYIYTNMIDKGRGFWKKDELGLCYCEKLTLIFILNKNTTLLMFIKEYFILHYINFENGKNGNKETPQYERRLQTWGLTTSAQGQDLALGAKHVVSKISGAPSLDSRYRSGSHNNEK